jgi:radical SAM superfamily enzyme YgiQ (UPF0313 family)
MNVLFIDPPGPAKGLNTGLGYLVGSLGKKKVNIEVLDLNNETTTTRWGKLTNTILDEQFLMNTLKDFKPDVIGISVKSFTSRYVRDIVKISRTLYPRIPIIVGGPHITLDGINFVKQEDVDIGVIGEGEQTILDLCRYFLGRRNIEKVDGIIYKNNGKIEITPFREFTKNLDKIPFPLYDNFSSVRASSGKIVEYPLITSRGCPYNCIYCSVKKISGKIWRFRSPKNIIKELIKAKEKYDIQSFCVLDDNFTLDMNRAKKICDELLSSGLSLKWSCPNGVRADRSDKELLTKMRESGCTSISIGVESADPYVFMRIKKGEKFKDIKRAIQLAKHLGLKVTGFFIIGLPYSTFEKDLKSIDFAKKMSIYAVWNLLVPYPYTEAYEWVNKHGKMLMDWKMGFHVPENPLPVFETLNYPASKRIRAYYKAIIRTGGLGVFSYSERSIPKRILKAINVCLHYDRSYFLSPEFFRFSFSYLFKKLWAT